MRWRAIAAAPRAPGASLGDSSSTLASPRAACDQWRVRAFAGDARPDRFEKSGSGGRHAATDDDALDAEGQGERADRPGQVVGHAVGDLERDLVAGRRRAEDIAGGRMGRQHRAPTGGDRLVGLASDRRTGGDRLEAAAQTARRRPRRPDRRRGGRPRRQSCCRRGAVRRRGRCRPRCRSRSRGRRCSPARRPTRRPLAGSARGPPRGRHARRRPGLPSSACSIDPSGRWVMPRLTAMLTEPSAGSTWPGMATPTAATSCRRWRRASSTSPAIWSTSADRSVGARCS